MTPEQEQWERVGRIVSAAVALQPDERPSFLDQACGMDETLRREVESLLSLDGSDNGGFLSSPAIEEAARLLTKTEPRFSTGSRLGNYEVLEFIEAGGMGEIYKARNLTLGNSVALKFLPTPLSDDANRLRRLKQEARAASALNHPNIVTVHDFVEAERSHFIVSEYVDGETLRQRLKRHQLSVREAIEIATQIATGLAAAHAVGVIHRDIKPENIMLRPDGYVKILDFGLAKLNEQSATNLSQGSQLKTEPGMPIGTPRYMAPEQVRGLALDARTDVWSLGVVLYEMLCGREPFEGKTNSDVLASILAREPAPLTSSMSDVPPKLQRVVSKALKKDPEERYQGVRDMLFDLENLSKPESLWEKINRHKAAAVVMLTVLVIAVTLGPTVIRRVRSRFTPSPPPPPPMKVSQLTSFVGFENNPAFSPDGNFLAFTWTGEKNDNLDIYIMRIGSTEPPFRLTTDPADDLHPVWSPDGTQIAFARFKSETDKASYVIPAPWGGSERKIFASEVKARWGGAKQMDWSPDGKWLVAPDNVIPDGPFHIFLTSPESRERRQLTFAPDQSFGDLFPQFSPDGKFVAFVRGNGLYDQDIYIVETAGGEPRQLTFESKHIEGLTWTTNGRKLIFSSNRDGAQRLWSISTAGGTPEAFTISETGASVPSISRSGNRLAFVKRISDSNMYSINLRDRIQGVRRPFASSTKAEWLPSFSSDGRRIAFTSDRSGANEIWLCNKDGSALRQLTTTASESGKPTWSPNGQLIAFDSKESGSLTRHVYVMSAEGGPRRLLTPVDNYDDSQASWSRDGQWIYFTTKRSGASQIWKVPATGGAPVQVTKQGGVMAFESADGQFVFYGKAGVDGIWRLPVNGGEEVLVQDSVSGDYGNWALMPDGIFYIDPSTKKGAAIVFYDFSSRRTKEVFSLGNVNVNWVGFAVSPDGQQAIYTLVDQESSDIMLVENLQL